MTMSDQEERIKKLELRVTELEAEAKKLQEQIDKKFREPSSFFDTSPGLKITGFVKHPVLSVCSSVMHSFYTQQATNTLPHSEHEFLFNYNPDFGNRFYYTHPLKTVRQACGMPSGSIGPHENIYGLLAEEEDTGVIFTADSRHADWFVVGRGMHGSTILRKP